jgi:hypothetical protein
MSPRNGEAEGVKADRPDSMLLRFERGEDGRFSPEFGELKLRNTRTS